MKGRHLNQERNDDFADAIMVKRVGEEMTNTEQHQEGQFLAVPTLLHRGNSKCGD